MLIVGSMILGTDEVLDSFGVLLSMEYQIVMNIRASLDIVDGLGTGFMIRFVTG